MTKTNGAEYNDDKEDQLCPYAIISGRQSIM